MATIRGQRGQNIWFRLENEFGSDWRMNFPPIEKASRPRVKNRYTSAAFSQDLMTGIKQTPVACASRQAVFVLRVKFLKRGNK